MAHISQPLDNRVEQTRAETMIYFTPHPGEVMKLKYNI